MQGMRRLAVTAPLVAVLVAAMAFLAGGFVRVRDEDARLAAGSEGIVFVRSAWIDSVADLPARGALVAVREESGGASFGRLMGVPGESLRLEAGELLLDDASLALPFDHQAWIPWSDTAREPGRASWKGLESWTRDASGWSGDFESPVVLLSRIDDGWLRDDGTRVAGEPCDAALRLAVRVRWSKPQCQMWLSLRHAGLVAQLVIQRDGDMLSNAVRVIHPTGATPPQGLAHADMSGLPLDAFEQEWTFEVRTGWAQVLVDGEHYMAAKLPPTSGNAHEGPSAAVRFRAGGATLVRLATWRAPVWRDDAPALHVARGHCFVLPDEPTAGARWPTCHRPWGAVLGRPVAVVWPPSAWRRLP